MLLTSAMGHDLKANPVRHSDAHAQFPSQHLHESAAIVQEERMHRTAAPYRTWYDVPATMVFDRTLAALHLGEKIEFLRHSDW